MKRAAALVFAFALSGCYESTAPLIAPGTADFPLAAPLRYTAFEWDAEKRQWNESEPGRLTRDGDHYVQTPDGSKPENAMPFALKSIGGGFYIGQEPGDSGYVYDLLRIDGNTAYEYGMSCNETADRKYVTQKLIDKIEKEGILGAVCTVSNFDRLVQVFRANSAGRQPMAKFVVAK